MPRVRVKIRPSVFGEIEKSHVEKNNSSITHKVSKKIVKPTRLQKSNRSAIQCLEQALHAQNPTQRIKYARMGLSAVHDSETQGLLLRQWYLGELECGHYPKAREISEQLLSLNVLPDVVRHDAARVCQAMGDYDAAVRHLEIASEVAPVERRNFHLSTLGSLLYAIGRIAEARIPLEKALALCPENTAPLLKAQLALVMHFVQPTSDKRELDVAYHELFNASCSEGYGRFILGELAFVRGERRVSQAHFQKFLEKVRRSRPAAQAALAPEVAHATKNLGRMIWN